MSNVVIGKRTTIGAALTATALALGKFWPEHLEAFVQIAIPVTFVAQLLIAKYFGVTSGDPK